MALDLLERPPQEDEHIYDDERASAGLDAPTAPPSSGADGLLSKVSGGIGQQHNPRSTQASSNKAAANELDALNKLGKGFTGVAAKAAAGGVDADAVAGGKLLQIKGNVKEHKGAYASIIGAIIILVFGVAGISTLPGAYKTIMNAITGKANVFITQEVSKYQESLASEYIKRQLTPGMKRRAKEGCSTTIIQVGCADKTADNSPPGRALNAWAQSSIENEWAKNGFELHYDTVSNRYFIRATGIEGDIDITKYLNTTDNLFHEIDKPELRTLFRAVNEKTSRLKRVLNLFSFGRLVLHDKWRITRCISECVISDKIAALKDSITDQKNAYKIKFAQRVLYPRSKVLGVAFACFFSGSECDPNKPDVNQETGEYNTKFEEDIQGQLDQILAEQGGDESLKKAQEILKGLREDGWQKYLIKIAVSEMLSKTSLSDAAKAGTAKVAGEAIPVLNIITVAAALLSGLSKLGPGTKAIVSMTQKDSMMRSYATDATYADETASGNVVAAEVSSFGRSFDAGQQLQPDGIHYGGASAGATPLYNAVVNDGYQTTTTAFGGVFASASAASSTDDPYHLNTYVCPLTQQFVPAGQLICNEQTLNYANYVLKTFGSISGFLNSPGINLLTQSAKLWTEATNTVYGTLTGPIVDLLMKFPGFTALQNQIIGNIEGLFKSLTGVIPNWISDNMNGGDHFIADFGGALASYNDYSENNLGGQPLSLAQRTAMINDQAQVDQKSFQMQPIMARIFDQNDIHSLVSRMSLALPYDFKPNIASMFTNLLTNPFGRIIHSLAMVFSMPNAWAADTGKTTVDPGYGITVYGIPIDNAVYSTEPTVYWDSNCTNDEHTKAWNASVKISTVTGLPEHTAADTCRFADQSSRAGAGYRDSNLALGK